MKCALLLAACLLSIDVASSAANSCVESSNQQSAAKLQQLHDKIYCDYQNMQDQVHTLRNDSQLMQSDSQLLQSEVDILKSDNQLLGSKVDTLELDNEVLKVFLNDLNNQTQLLQSRVDTMESDYDALEIMVQELYRKNTKFASCAELYQNGSTTEDGVYDIHVGEATEPTEVYCDMTTSGGGWTVFQRRFDGSVDFFLPWDSYKNGFGDIGGEHWLGNDHLAEITSSGSYVLRFDFEGFDGESGWAEYTDFSISDESDNFRLNVNTDQYSGNVGDSISGSFANHNGKPFSTTDRVAGNGCEPLYKGGWWFDSCLTMHLNGPYYDYSNVGGGKGIVWYTWKGFGYSLKKTSMKFRPFDY